MVPEMSAVEELARLREEALGCTRCALAAGRTQVVFGVGNPTADLMFVGEGPGREEDLQGEPFVGRSGKLLDLLMRQEMGIGRDECYIANVVKCLRYNALIQLGDGSWERIGRLVRTRYSGTVKTVDAGGRIIERRVIGWHASPLAGRRVFRLTYRTSKRAGLSRVSIQATGDHEVLTEGGWTQIQRMRSGTRIATGQGLSPVAHDVVVGSLLGDAYVSLRSAHVSMGHSQRQVGYALFKASLLSELEAIVRTGMQVKAVGGGETNYTVLHMRTLASRAFRTLASDFYPSGKKRVPSWIADSLNPRSLAIWFLDDGYMRMRPPRNPLAEIAPCAFSGDDLDILVTGLDRLGLPARVRGGRIIFDVLTSRRLARTIAPYVPESMRYKLPPDVAEELPFTPDLFTDRCPITQYDEAIVEELDFAGTDTTFFCIDVEETHNFVTAGGVVHNCRPPGNRDPLPAEIEACRPYLEGQIDLIAPKVVVTLGNFAMKTLLGTADGIRKMRGRVYPFHGVHLVPTYHPAAALRSGGEVVAEMRADFVRAKALLRSSK